jgi:hypothetical protein
VTWRHARAWTVSSDQVLFGRVVGISRLADGTLAVADGQLGQVLLLGEGGACERVLPVAGEGPGQVARLGGVAASAADELLLVQPWPARVAVIARDGTPRRQWRPAAASGGASGGLASLLGLRAGGRWWLALVVRTSYPGPRQSRTRATLTRREAVAPARGTPVRTWSFTSDIEPGVVDETVGHVPRRGWALLPGGRAVVAPRRDAYRLEIHDPDRGLVRILTRDVEPLPRPQRERDLIRRGFTWTVDGRERALELRLHDTAEVIQTLVGLDPVRVLVGGADRFHRLPAGVTARYDLVDLAAATVRPVHLAVPCRPGTDALLVLPDRDVVVVRQGWGALSGSVAGGPADASGDDPPAIELWQHLGEESP